MHLDPVMWEDQGRLVYMFDGQFDSWQHTLSDTGLQVPVGGGEEAGHMNIVLLVPIIISNVNYLLPLDWPVFFSGKKLIVPNNDVIQYK